MGFHSKLQLAGACGALLRMQGFTEEQSFWTSYGPCKGIEAILLGILHGSTTLSTAEQIIVRVAFDLWNGSGGAKWMDVVTRIDPGMTRAIAALLLAITQKEPSHIDDWYDTYGSYRVGDPEPE